MSRLSLFRPRSLVVLAWLSTAVLVLIAASSAYGRSARPSDPFIPASVANHGASRPSGTCPPASSATPAANRPGLAPAVSAAELLCRPPASNPALVPKLFHQSWKTTQLPAKFQRWSDSCREKHPDWEWVLWTDEDNLRLVKEHFPWLLDTYLNLPGSIYRADLARNLYMYQFGGVYADLDTECLLSTADGLEEYSIPFSNGVNDTSSTEDATKIALFGRMGTDQTYEQSIPNAWMAASPGHPFFLRSLEFAHAELEKSKSFFHQFWHRTPNAEHMTGPIALRKTIIAYGASGEEDEIVLLPGRLVYPYNWYTDADFLAVCSAEQETFDDAVCKEKLEVTKKKSISITYWSHTHKGQGSDAHNIGLISSDK